MKKTLMMILVALICLVFAACEQNSNSSDNSSEGSSSPSSTPTSSTVSNDTQFGDNVIVDDN